EEVDRITDEQFKILSKEYEMSENDIFINLLSKKIIDRHSEIQKDKLDDLYTLYPILRNSLKPEKVRKGDTNKKYVTVRESNYREFQQLWETINQKVFIEYNLGSEKEIKNLLLDILKNEQVNQLDSISITKREIERNGDEVKLSNVEGSIYSKYDYIEILPYNEFLKTISKPTFIPIQTIHQALVEYNEYDSIDNNTFFTRKTALNLINAFKSHIANVMLSRIEYKQLDIDIHPTALTNPNGTLKKVAAYDIGIKSVEEKPQENYLYNEFFYDSNEYETITEEIEEVIVFGKIPRRSIRIPVINGQTYSPDFA